MSTRIRIVVGMLAIGASACSFAVPNSGPTIVYLGKLKGPPVSDVAPSAMPASYDEPDVLPPKEPAINVLASGDALRGGT